MLLVMDVGNSHTVLGLFEGASLRARWRIVTTNYRTADELRILFTMLFQQEGLRPDTVAGCAVASVVPPLNHALEHACRDTFAATPLFVEPGVKTGLVIQVENPKEVGADRIVNAVAAVDEHEGPLIVVDFGTATTFDAVSGQAEYLGGAIVPGVQISADALFERCAKLPRVDIVRPASVIGKNTIAHICSGLTYGYADLVDGLVRRMAAEMAPAPKVIATGGLAPFVATLSQTIDVVDPDLTLKGLKIVFDRNKGARG